MYSGPMTKTQHDNSPADAHEFLKATDPNYRETVDYQVMQFWYGIITLSELTAATGLTGDDTAEVIADLDRKVTAWLMS